MFTREMLTDSIDPFCNSLACQELNVLLYKPLPRHTWFLSHHYNRNKMLVFFHLANSTMTTNLHTYGMQSILHLGCLLKAWRQQHATMMELNEIIRYQIISSSARQGSVGLAEVSFAVLTFCPEIDHLHEVSLKLPTIAESWCHVIILDEYWNCTVVWKTQSGPSFA